MLFRSWTITFRPTDGVTDAQIEALQGWLDKADWHYAVTHKSGKERHVHAAIFFPKATNKSNLATRILGIKGICGTLSGPEQKVFRNGIKIMYNGNFIENYMLTHDDPVVIGDDLPMSMDRFEIMNSYYPPSGDETAKRPPRKLSPWYLDMEQRWFARKCRRPNLDLTFKTIEDLVKYHECVARDISVIADARVHSNMCKKLLEFILLKAQADPQYYRDGILQNADQKY